MTITLDRLSVESAAPNRRCGEGTLVPEQAPEMRAAATGEAGRLGTKSIKEHHQVTGVDLRKRLWALQRVMWKITDFKRLRGCHRWIGQGAGAASLRWVEQGRATWGNLQTSSSVWASPLSASAISKTRSMEVAEALETWFEQGEHYSVEFLTLTLAHTKEQSLKEVWDTVAYAWRGVTGTASWRGGARYEGDKARFGVEHWLKSVEVTHGKNGWHVHIHCLLFINKQLGSDERAVLEARLYDRWQAAAQRKGFKAPSRQYGVKLEEAVQKKSANDLGAYMAKGALSSVAETLSWEITAGQTAKTARSEQNRTPFQVLDSIRKRQDYARSNPDVQVWLEWEEGSLGRRQMAWSKGAKQALGVGFVADEEAEELGESSEGTSDDMPVFEVASVSFEEWSRVRETGGKLCDDVVQRQEITDYVAKAKTEFEAYRRARTVLEAYGVRFQQEGRPLAIQKIEPITMPVKIAESREVLKIESGEPGVVCGGGK